MAPSAFESGNEDRGSEEKLRNRIGNLKVHIKEARGIPAAHFEHSGTVGTVDTYCVVSVERTKRSTAVIRKTLNPVWNHEMTFTVTDLTSDVIIQVFSMKSIGGLDVDSKLIGQAIIPIPRLLPDLASWELIAASFLAGTDATPTHIQKQEELELFPLPKELTRFQSIPDELSKDLKGMARPRSSLGVLHVQLELTLTAPLLRLYCSSVPAPPASRLTAGQASNKADPEVLDFNVIKWNCHRIRTVLTRPPAWARGLAALRDWERPAASFCALLSTLVAILTLPLWLIPAAAAAAAIALSVCGARARGRDDGEVRTWHREAPRDPREPTTLVGKALLGKALVLRVQVTPPRARWASASRRATLPRPPATPARHAPAGPPRTTCPPPTRPHPRGGEVEGRGKGGTPGGGPPGWGSSSSRQGGTGCEPPCPNLTCPPRGELESVEGFQYSQGWTSLPAPRHVGTRSRPHTGPGPPARPPVTRRERALGARAAPASSAGCARPGDVLEPAGPQLRLRAGSSRHGPALGGGASGAAVR
jgi:hypothetical protein